jgi:hypothetical protein
MSTQELLAPVRLTAPAPTLPVVQEAPACRVPLLLLLLLMSEVAVPVFSSSGQ